jgi:hypothetical protein
MPGAEPVDPARRAAIEGAVRAYLASGAAGAEPRELRRITVIEPWLDRPGWSRIEVEVAPGPEADPWYECLLVDPDSGEVAEDACG